MKYLKPLIITSIAALCLGATVGALTLVGINPVKAVTQARCEAGGVLTHSQAVPGTADDHDRDDQPAGALNVPVTPGKTTTRPSLTGQNLIPNPTLKNSGGDPHSWLTNVYGNSNAKFDVVSGKDGAPALRVDITSYKDGDADWYYPPVSVTPGGYYTFQDTYRSSVATRPLLMLRHQSGQDEYIDLKAAPAAETWTNYSVTFIVPSDVRQALVYHPLASVGTLITSNHSLTATQSAGFSKALVSLTFDDGWKSIHDHALPLLKRYDMVSTQYLVTGYLGRAAAYMTPADVYDMLDAGNEIGSHTVNHLDLTKATPDLLKHELTRSKQDLTKCFGEPTGYAAPYGTYNSATIQAARGFYQTARSTDTGFNTAENLNPYGLLVQNMTPDTTPAQVQGWLEAAKAHNAWLILVYHQIDGSDSPYARSPENFEQDLKAIKASGISVKTVRNAYQDVKNKAHK